MLLVTTANMAGGYPAIVVTTTIPGLRFQQWLVGSTLMQPLFAYPDDVTASWGSGLAS
jgi:hypothetical protein